MRIRLVLIVALMAMMVTMTANAAIITYNFATGSGINSPGWPGSAGINVSGGVSLTTTTLLLDDPNTGGVINALQLVGSGTLYCAGSSTVAGACAATATSETSGSGHAAGIGVGTDARINGAETITITVLPGYIAQLLSVQTTALYAGQTPIEQWRYAVDGGVPVVLNATNQAIDIYSINTYFNTLAFSVPAGSNTFALYAMEVNITPIAAVPEPGSFVLLSGGLLGLGLIARRRTKR